MKVFLTLALSLLLLVSCATAPRDPFATTRASTLRWPAPPETSRVEYHTSITDHRNLFEEAGVGSAFARFFGGEADSRLVRPHALCVDPDGGLLVTDPGAARVHFYNWHDRKYVPIGAKLDGGLPSPVGVAVARDRSILVADSRLASIEHFSRGGKHLGRFAPDCQLQRPAGLAVDPISGNVFLVDVLAHKILVLSPDGRMLNAIGSPGSAAGEFNFPTHIALDEDGNILLADSMNFRIQKLTPDGQSLSVYGRAGDARGDFARPKGVASAGGGVYLAVEGLYDSLIFFNAAGDLLMTLGGAGSEPGQFWLPAGVAVDRARGLIFVADSYNSRVQVFHLLPGDATESQLIPGEVTP